MKTRNTIIICLALIGTIMFGVIQFVIVPDNNRKLAKYIVEQQNPTTHDLNSILKFKSKYMGDASNIFNLFAALPLNNFKAEYQLYPDKLKVELNYNVSRESIGEDITLAKALIYNSIAAFALIDNLEIINYNFGDSKFYVFRADVKRWYGKDPKELLNKNEWKNNVQGKLKNRQYVWNLYEAIVK